MTTSNNNLQQNIEEIMKKTQYENFNEWVTNFSLNLSDIWNEKRKQHETAGLSQEEIEDEKKNWLLLDAKRIFIDNSFDFTLETIGIYSNMALVVKSCDILIQKCKDFMG